MHTKIANLAPGTLGNVARVSLGLEPVGRRGLAKLLEEGLVYKRRTKSGTLKLTRRGEQALASREAAAA